MTIRIRILSVILLMSWFIILVGEGAGLVFTWKNIERSIENDLSVVANTADRFLSTEINLQKANVALVVQYLMEADEKDRHQILENQIKIHKDIMTLTIVEDGRIVDYAGFPLFHKDFIDTEYTRRAFLGEQVISTSRIYPDGGDLLFHVIVPMEMEGSRAKRILIATIDGMFFSKALTGLNVWDSGYIFVIDGDGYTLANPDPDWVRERINYLEMAKDKIRYKGAGELISKMCRGETGTGRCFLDGTDRFCAYRPITGSTAGWSLGVTALLDESPLKDSFNGLMLVGVVCFLLSAAAAFGTSIILEKPYLTVSGMVNKLEHQDKILYSMNDMAAILSGSKIENFDADLSGCLGMMASSVNADNVRIFKNSTVNGKLCFSRLYQWAKENHLAPATTSVYEEVLPETYGVLSAGKCINGLTAGFPETDRRLFDTHKILSILIIPVFIHDNFWGMVTFDNSKNERIFSPEEENIMRSGALIMANALQRNESEKALILAHEEAVASTQAKSHFLANMSHEMRTPLNAIIGLSDLTLGANRLQGEDSENLGKIYSSGMTLLGIINDILDLSKIESGKFEIIPVEYDLPSLVNDTVTVSSVYIGSKNIEFRLHVDADLPALLFGDDLRIKQIFNNILSNAFKYTQEGSVLWSLSSERAGDSVWLVSIIEDTGIGIRPGNLKKLFSAYNQVDTLSNRKVEGTGLGLSIAKRLTEMMDGDITVESEYGKGSIFTIRFRQGLISEDVIGTEVAEKLQNFHYYKHKLDLNTKLVRASIPYARVLVVDDIAANLDVARGLMKPYNMHIDCVTSGGAAVNLIREKKVKYNAVFMDHMMPDMDGMEATRIIRQEISDDYAKNLPIIALTANAIVGNEELFLQNGFTAFLSKPIDIVALDNAINRWVRDRELEKKLNMEQPAAPEEKPERRRGKSSRRVILDRRTGADRRGIDEWEMSGINIKKGLDYFGGDESIYYDVLKSYIENTPSILDKLHELYKENLDKYKVIVHGIKSSSRSIGADAIGSQAEALERAAKEGNFSFISMNNYDFIQKTEILIEKISLALESIENENLKPVRAEPDREVLTELLAACRSYNIDEVDASMEKLENFSYESNEDLIIWLREQVDLMGFKLMAERLEKSIDGK